MCISTLSGVAIKSVSFPDGLGTSIHTLEAYRDKWITAEMASGFESNMNAAGKKAMVYHYPADHAFANPSSPRYNEKAAKEARAVVTAYLKGK